MKKPFKNVPSVLLENEAFHLDLKANSLKIDPDTIRQNGNGTVDFSVIKKDESDMDVDAFIHRWTAVLDVSSTV